MLRRFAYILSSVLLVLLLAGVAAPQVYAKRPQSAPQQSQLTASEAAARAQAQYGGKVLKVKRQGNGYSVKLLLDSGRVITVSIRG